MLPGSEGGSVDPQANDPRDTCSGRRKIFIRMEEGGSESLGTSPGTSSEIGLELWPAQGQASSHDQAGPDLQLAQLKAVLSQ